MLGDEALELRGEALVPAEPKLGLDSLLERFEAQLGQARDLRLRERLVQDVGVRIAPPQRERLRQSLGSLGRPLPG